MLSTALFSSHHGRFQPGKTTKSNKSSLSTSSSSNNKSVANYGSEVPTLCRFVKFDTSDNFTPFQPQSPLHQHRQHQNQFSTDDNRQDDKKDAHDDTISDHQIEPESIDENHQTDTFLGSLAPQSDSTNRRRTNSFFRQNRSSAAALRRSSTSSSSTSTSQRSSNSSKLSDKLKSQLVNSYSAHYQSCPDLLKPCLNRNSPSYDSSWSSTLSRHKFSKSEKNLLNHKPIPQWSLDDVLTWLQSVGFEDVTSVLIGYEITGNDVLQWNDQSLGSLGITDPSKREKILDELQKLKLLQSSSRSSPKKVTSQRQFSLFSMVRLSQYDQIKVIELPPSTTVRDFTVATDPMEMALVVTSCKSTLIELKKGDLIIELNGVSCIKLAPVDFNKLLHELNGHKYQMVVLRKSPYDDQEIDTHSSTTGPKTVSATKSLNVFHL